LNVEIAFVDLLAPHSHHGPPILSSILPGGPVTLQNFINSGHLVGLKPTAN
jgi:hypothetical protein